MASASVAGIERPGNLFINLWELGTWYWFFGQAAG